MATKDASASTPGIGTPDFEAAAERIRSMNEKLLDAYKHSGNISMDAYEKTLASLLDFEEKAADATQLEWVSALASAHAKFVTEVSAAYTRAARDMLK